LIHYEVDIPKGADLSTSEQMIEDLCESHGLQIMLKGTLSKHLGCVHYHYKSGKQKGTLEITLWLKEQRIWFSTRANRSAEWVSECIEQIKEEIENCLKK
jgi:hypothetical protein